MQPTCRKCGAGLEPDDIHADLGVARCRSCRTVMDLGAWEAGPAAHGARAGGAVALAAPGVRVREPVALPPKFDVEERPSSFAVQWRWLNAKVVALAVFCVIWDLAIWLIVRGALESGRSLSNVPWPHAAIGVGLTYFVLAGLLNRTRLEVGAGTLRIRHFPIPWPGGRTLHAREVDQLYSVEHETRTKSGVTLTYRLCAVPKGGGSTQFLITGLQRPDQALFLEQQVEAKLRIEDREVHGELPR